MAQPDESKSLADLARMRSQRDEAAFGRLYDAYSPILYRVCLLILKSEAEAQEALQDAFLHLWERSEGFDPARGKLYTWFCLVTRSKAIDRLRRNARSRKRVTLTAEGSFDPGLEQAPDHAPNALERSAEKQLRDQVRGLLASLPSAQAEVLKLAYLEGLSQSEIARRTGKPLGTVKTQMRTATQRLTAMVTPEMRAWL